MILTQWAFILKRNSILLSLILSFVFSFSSVLAVELGDKDRLLKVLSLNSDNIKAKVDLSYIYVKEQNGAKAVALLTPSLDRLSKKGLLVLAKAHRLQKNYQQEIKVLKLLLIKQPRSAALTTLMGDAFFNVKSFDEAVEYYKKAIQINRSYKKAYHRLLELFESTVSKNPRARYEQRVILSDMVKVFGSQLEFDKEFCRLYSEDGFLKETVKFCTRAITQSKDYSQGYIHLGLALVDLGQTAKGRKKIFAAAARFSDSSFVQNSAGQQAFEQNNFPVSNKYYLSCLRAYEKGSDIKNSCLLGAAKSFYELQNYEQALNYYKKACQSDRAFTQNFRKAASRLRGQARKKWHLAFAKGLDTCR